jgi:tellurite resistance protein TerC
VEKFHLLRFGLAVVLVFVGLKMVWLDAMFGGKFPIVWSLAIIAVSIGASIVLSLVFPKAPEEHAGDHTPGDGPAQAPRPGEAPHRPS